jgi:hypothetical protein
MKNAVAKFSLPQQLGSPFVGFLDPVRNISQRMEIFKPYSCTRHGHHAITSPPDHAA